MANTEGMPDEFVESLMTSSISSATNSSAGNSTTNKSRPKNVGSKSSTPSRFSSSAASSTRRRRMEERMGMPMQGGMPAAKVVRASKNQSQQRRDGQRVETVNDVEEEENDDNQKDTGTTAARPVVGDIIEHATSAMNRSRTGNFRKKGGKASRFAQQQQYNHSGFPSVNVPLGTFVSKKKPSTAKHKQPPAVVKKSAVSTQKGIQIQKDSKKNNQPSPSREKVPLSKGLTKKTSNNDDASLLESSHRDAQNMLQQMSIEEIKDYQMELEAALSPKMKAFLKQRHDKKKKTQQQPQPNTGNDQQHTINDEELQVGNTKSNGVNNDQFDASQNQVGSDTSSNVPFPRTEEDDKKEKERLAKILSSVQTHQDMDKAYQEEMKETHPLMQHDNQSSKDTALEPSTGRGGEGNDDENSFQLACDLLRSTAPRQALWAAKVVSERLEHYIQQQKYQHVERRDWPLVLPVSLRCLLDQSLFGSSTLHTYVLKSLYHLLILNARSEHRLYLMNTKHSKTLPLSSTAIYQEFYLDDAVPTIPLEGAYARVSAQPLPLDDKNGKSKGNKKNKQDSGAAAAYATSSSATSAQADGKAFEKDPMWTLLSKMRIIPRLAQLLNFHNNNNNTRTASQSKTGHNDKKLNPAAGTSKITTVQPLLPPEAWVASCGILSMLCQRSPGAASAIVQHGTLVPNIMEQTIQRLQIINSTQDDEQNSISQDDNDTLHIQTLEMTEAAMTLFCTLARQSRVAAQSLPMEEILPTLLATPATSDLEFRLQRLSLILWRTVLRYGQGLPALSTMMKLAARHMALPYNKEYSLSTEYLSAFAQVLDCARVVRSKKQLLRQQDDVLPEVIHADQIQVLSMASSYLASTRRQIIPKITSPVGELSTPVEDIGLTGVTGRGHDGNNNDDNKNSNENGRAARWRWNATRIRFLAAFWGLSDPENAANEEIKTEELTMEDELQCLEVLDLWLESDGEVDTAWNIACWYYLDKPNEASSSSLHGSTRSLETEASACSFIEAAASLLLTLEKSSTFQQNRLVRELGRTVTKKFAERILYGIRSFNASSSSPLGSTQTEEKETSIARRGWLNRCYFAVAKVLFHSISMGTLTSSSDMNLVRALVFSLLGRLERGDESIAAVLFSQDHLFQTNSDPIEDSPPPESSSLSSSSSSSISSMFLGELCGSDRARKQLDHSFKLQHGFGLTSEGYGPFALDSLLSNADLPGPASSSSSSPSSPSADNLLPLGEYWLWQSLSGSIRMKTEDVSSGTTEAARVLSAVLNLLFDLEECENLAQTTTTTTTTTTTRGYASMVSVGVKLYFLINICLQPEVVLRDGRVLEVASKLFDRLWLDLDQPAALIFCKICMEHTDPSKKTLNSGSGSGTGGDGTNDPEGENLDDNEKKFLEMLNKESSNRIGVDSGMDVSPAMLRTLEAFVEDLSTAYNDYGAQYDFFTKCIRIFLFPVFPSSIRCRTLRELRGVLHLLTLPIESEDEIAMSVLLSQSLLSSVGKEEKKFGIQREPSEVLDAFGLTLLAGQTTRPLSGFVLYYCIASLAGNLVLSMSETMGLVATKKRLLTLDSDAVTTICETALDYIDKLSEQSSTVNISQAAILQTTKYMTSKSTNDAIRVCNGEYLDEYIAKIKKRIDENFVAH